MKKLWLTLIIFLGLLINLTSFANEELINALHSKIVINPDASLTITEIITVNAQHQQIKRGITRSFPTRYTNQLGIDTNVDFSLIQVLLDQKPCNYFVTNAQNGIVVNFGDDNFIEKGQHIYEITYQTNRQLAFQDKWTELYFNIIGNNVIFPVLQASAEIYLPSDINPSKIELNGYTGVFGSKHQDYTAWITSPNICHFKTTKTLSSGESFTISVAFPDSDQIKKPSFFTKLNWYIQDNLGLIILLILIIILLITYSLIYYYQVYLNKPVIMPLFNPPANMLPAECAFLYYKSLHKTALTATILDMAVCGYLKIRHTTRALLNQDSYALEKNSHDPKIMSPHYDGLNTIWFEKQNKVDLNYVNQNIINTALNRLNLITKKHAILIKPMHEVLVLGLILSFITSITALILLQPYQHTLVPISILILIAINLIFCHLLKDYTPSGKIIYAQIAGFKMYLEYAEKERIIKLNPPDMNTELFEKYLPYAIALDVDIAWTRAFEHIYLQPQAHTYHPYWWLGPRLRNRELNLNLNNLNKSITRIMAPQVAPGTTSGRGGRGFSGGGGGGGGIGGR